MRGKIREIVPSAETGGLEELIVPETAAQVEADPAASLSPPIEATRKAGHAPAPGRAADSSRVAIGGGSPSAGDLGPNGDVVIDFLVRAERLTPEEARALEREAGWRWGFLGLATTVMAPVASLPVARALALARGRAEGRAEAIGALERMVVAIARNRPRTRGRVVLSAGVANAGLAVLVRDLIDPETFEVLFGPWREVMHH